MRSISQFSDIVEHVAGQLGADVAFTVELNAKKAEGLEGRARRVVSENAVNLGAETLNSGRHSRHRDLSLTRGVIADGPTSRCVVVSGVDPRREAPERETLGDGPRTDVPLPQDGVYLSSIHGFGVKSCGRNARLLETDPTPRSVGSVDRLVPVDQGGAAKDRAFRDVEFEFREITVEPTLEPDTRARKSLPDVLELVGSDDSNPDRPRPSPFLTVKQHRPEGGVMGLHAGSHHPSMRLPRFCEGCDTRVLTVVI